MVFSNLLFVSGESCRTKTLCASISRWVLLASPSSYQTKSYDVVSLMTCFLLHAVQLVVPLVEKIVERPGDGGVPRQKVVVDLIVEEGEIVDPPFRDMGVVMIEIDPLPPVDAIERKAFLRRVDLACRTDDAPDTGRYRRRTSFRNSSMVMKYFLFCGSYDDSRLLSFRPAK